MEGKKMIFLGVIIVLIVSYISYVFINPRMHLPGDRMKVLMCGRSTMMLWFKHWNWPYPLRIKTTYRNWPIPYDTYAHGNLYLEFSPLADPFSNGPNMPFGQEMVKTFREGLGKDRFDAAFFKFCFVDFPVDEQEKEKRFHDLTSTIIEVHRITSNRGIKLIVGNALPLPNANKPTLTLQKEYNEWLLEFARNKPDVLIFDLFNPLSLQDGRMNMQLARSNEDSHPGEKAFAVLDKKFFAVVENWLSKQ